MESSPNTEKEPQVFYPVMKTEAFSLSFVVPIGKSVSNALSPTSANGVFSSGAGGRNHGGIHGWMGG